MYKIHVARAYPALEPNTVLLDNALATMGAGLPAAIAAKVRAIPRPTPHSQFRPHIPSSDPTFAAKVIEPSRQCVALCGDGGFMMNSQELETAVRMKLHIVVVVLNDSGYGMIKWKQGTGGFPAYGLDYTNPNFVQYANSYGAGTHPDASRTHALRARLAHASPTPPPRPSPPHPSPPPSVQSATASSVLRTCRRCCRPASRSPPST